MPKFLKFILNCCAAITALGYFFILLLIPIAFVMGHRVKGIEEGLIPLILFALHRLPIMVGEFLLVRPRLSGENVNKELFKINIYVFFSLFLSSIICTGIFLRPLRHWMPSWIAWQYVVWPLMTVIAGLIALAEVYIKTDYFMEKHLTANPKKVAQLLSVIIISVYLLSVAGVALYVFSIESFII